jgi:ribosome-associated translation inhibitor RaiA
MCAPGSLDRPDGRAKRHGTSRARFDPTEVTIMAIPLQITFRNMEVSPSIEARIRALTGRLERHCSRITSCRVIVESPHRHHHKGRHYRIQVDLRAPGREVVGGHDSARTREHEKVYLAIRDAFRATRRQLAG